MEIERKADKDKVFMIFCEKHRPLKIVKELEDRDRQTLEEIQNFCKVIEKCQEIEARSALKEQNKEKASPERAPKQAKWKEKDRKQLVERVRDVYLKLRKLKVIVAYVDPMKKGNKRSEKRDRKKKKKQLEP